MTSIVSAALNRSQTAAYCSPIRLFVQVFKLKGERDSCQGVPRIQADHIHQADQYRTDRKAFDKKAAEYTRQVGRYVG